MILVARLAAKVVDINSKRASEMNCGTGGCSPREQTKLQTLPKEDINDSCARSPNQAKISAW